MSKKAVLLGATGLIGSELLQLLLADDHIAEVRVLTRRATGLKHAKLKEVIGDLLDPDFLSKEVKGDLIFCCIGTTQAKTPDLTMYRKIDHGIPVHAAEAASSQKDAVFLVVSSMGANAGSRIFYNRTKGQMEEDVKESGVAKAYIFRPSLLMGDRQERRTMEGIGQAVFALIGRFLPKKYRGIKGETVARAMLRVAKEHPDQTVFPSDEIHQWA